MTLNLQYCQRNFNSVYVEKYAYISVFYTFFAFAIYSFNNNNLSSNCYANNRCFENKHKIITHVGTLWILQYFCCTLHTTLFLYCCIMVYACNCCCCPLSLLYSYLFHSYQYSLIKKQYFTILSDLLWKYALRYLVTLRAI